MFNYYMYLTSLNVNNELTLNQNIYIFHYKITRIDTGYQRKYLRKYLIIPYQDYLCRTKPTKMMNILFISNDMKIELNISSQRIEKWLVC